MRKTFLIFYLKKSKKLTSPTSIINYALEQHKGRTFLIEAERNIAVKYEDLEIKIAQTIETFAEIGLQQGDVLAFNAPNCPEYFELRAACHFTGILFMGLPGGLNAEDLTYFLTKAGAKAIYDADGLRPISKTPYRSAPKDMSPVSTLNLSSGTTRKLPKVVQLTDENWTESLYNYVRNSNILPDKHIIFLCTLPFATAGSTTFLPSLLAGITYVVVKENIQPADLVRYIKRYSVNRLYITPSCLIELLTWCQENNERLSMLKNILTGTEPFPKTRLHEAIEFFGPIIYVGYGMVEVLPPISILGPRDYEKLGSVGKVLKGVQIKFYENGKIALKSKTVSPGYFDTPSLNADHFKDGWFYTNDYGHLDHGYLYVRGREEDIVVREPKLVFAREIEEKIYGLVFVKHCAVLPGNGRPAHIFVSLKKEIEEEEAREKIIEMVVRSQDGPLRGQPTPQITIKQHMPINSVGKLDRKKLREEAYI